MLPFRMNHGRGLWQVLKMVRAFRSVQLISYAHGLRNEITSSKGA